ncbi:unnamed protein product [Closterium sp. NIES-53]
MVEGREGLVDDSKLNLPAEVKRRHHGRWQQLDEVAVVAGEEIEVSTYHQQALLGSGTRPIAVGECLLQLIAKAALFLTVPAARGHFAPLQFGVAVAGGIEAAIHTARTYLEVHPDAVALQIDLANAFNAVERRAVYEGLKNEALEDLIPLVRLSYGAPSSLFLDHDFGTAPLQSARGVVLMAYADDITLLGDATACTAAFAHLTSALATLGLVHNPAKCAAWSAAAVDPSSVPSGVEILGSPIGTPHGCASAVRERLTAAAAPLPLLLRRLKSRLSSPHGCASAVRERLTAAAAPLPLLAQMDPQLSLLLLTRCVSHSASFLARTTPLEALPEAEWSAWGEQLLLTFLDSAHIMTLRSDAERRRIWRQAALPVTLGGLGITDPADEGSYAYLASVISASHLMHSLVDSLHPAVTALLPLLDPTHGSAHALPARLAVAEAALPPEALEVLQAGKADPKGQKLQQSIALAVHSRRFLRVMREARRMRPNPLSGHAQRMQSVLGPGTGDWLLAIPLIPSLRMGPSQLSTAAAFRLGLPLPVPRRCGC